ncbi:methyltransferase domain-containing protein [Streptomyces sp. NPDC037389]|uniref:methyltransferase domain-containing protein n=1 Tax=Streptomyces sp. NPDC037389 TaxID=3155369 RepID=UPI0033EB9494
MPVFGAVPRSAFLPDLVRRHDLDTGDVSAIDRRADPDAWQTAVTANTPLVTQWDDGRHEGERGRVATISSSMPSLVSAMLTDLDIRPGQRVLEIGTGTGWNAGLLAHRLGAGSVVSVGVDEDAVEAARGRLGRLGPVADVVHGDGFAGYGPGAPYDRIVVTCGVRTLPFAWVEQTRPGGVVLVPWGTHFSSTEATARLVVAEDGRSAQGTFTRSVTFMRLRSQRLAHASYDTYVTEESRETARISTTSRTHREVFADTYDVNRFVLGLRVPDCTYLVDRPREGRRPVWPYSLSDRPWACVIHRDGRREFTVHQAGPRSLWDELEEAYEWWIERGRPGFGRLGLTVDRAGQRAWSDEPGGLI